jgi:hypothetical protein
MTTSVTDSSGASVGVYSGITSTASIGATAGASAGGYSGATYTSSNAAAANAGAGSNGANGANAAALAEAQARIMAMPVADENAALNIMVSFLNIAQRRGVFSIDESAKIWECIKKFQKQ